MKICPTCRMVYPDSTQGRCPRDGGKLTDARKFAEAEADPLRGQTIAGRFRILDRIAVGGMGTVYRAEQLGLARHVALKILKRELAWERDTITRFHREAKAMSLLVHQNTVRVFDFGETTDGLLYLAMEMLEGELLTERLQREGPLDVRESISLVRQILGSLSEAHSKGIVHRDLKPDNIFLGRVEGHDGVVVKVLDFGIAKIVQDDRRLDQLETQAGTVFGTPRYMSPEQAQGKPLDPRSDLYSVGVLLYQMLTGRAPFLDEDAVVVMAKHIREKPRRPREVAPNRPIPPSLDRAVMKAVEKEPGRRFASADDFASRLDACIPDVVVWTEAMARGRKPPLPKAAIAASVSLIGLALVVAAYLALGSGNAVTSHREGGEPIAAAGARQPAQQERLPARRSVPVTTVPPGAQVWRGNLMLGITPLSLQLTEMDVATIALRKDGYATAVRVVPAAAAAQVIILQPSVGNLAVAQEPPTNLVPRITIPAPVRRTGTAPRTRPTAPRGQTTASNTSPTTPAPRTPSRTGDVYQRLE